MSQPTPYTRKFSFTNDQTANPSTKTPGNQLDIEYNAILLTLNQTLANLALIQRDDGQLANGSVGADQLVPGLATGVSPATIWASPVNYSTNSTVFFGSKLYRALVSHISGTFATDLANGNWLLVGDFTFSVAGTANEITATSGAAGNYTLSLPAALSFAGKTVTGGTFSSPTVTGGTWGKPLVILFTGQSFLVQTQALSWTPETNLRVWNWNGADGNVGTAYAAPSNTTINLAQKFASDVARANPTRAVFLINIAFSGQAISHWLPGATAPDAFLNIQNNITAALSAAGATQIDLFGWVQGQGDCLPLNTAYVANHATMMSRFWADTTPGTIWFPRETPALIFSCPSVADSNGLNADADNMNLLLQAVAAADPDKRRYVYLPSLPGTTYINSTAHPTAQGHFAIGAMASAEFLRGTGRNSIKNIAVDPASGNIRLGNPAITQVPFAFNNNATAMPVLPAPIGATIQIVGADAVDNFAVVDAFGGFAGLTLRRADGTLAAPTALVNGDLIAAFGAKGHNGTAYSTGNVSGLLVWAAENWTSAHQGTYSSIYNTPPGTATIAENVRFSTGAVQVFGATSGSITFAVPAVAGANTITWPAGTTNFSATGGTGQVVQQATAGGAFTVGQLSAENLSGTAWTTYTPTVTSSAGTPTTVSATGRYKQIGKTIFLQISITVTAVGTASGVMYATLPANANTSGNYVGTAYEHTVTGNTGAAAILGFFNATRIQTGQYNGATWWVNTYTVDISTTYEIP